MSLTADQVKDIMDAGEMEFVNFTAESRYAFINVWTARLQDAKCYFKRRDLEESARSILEFAMNTSPSNLRLYVDPMRKISFLYDASTQRFLSVL